MAVWIPGFVPTKTHIRFGERMSLRGGRWAYFEGSAYLEGLRFFLGRGEASVDGLVGEVREMEVVRVRFVERGVEDGGVLDVAVVEAAYWNFVRRSLKDGVEGLVVVSDASWTASRVGSGDVDEFCCARVRAIVEFLVSISGRKEFRRRIQMQHAPAFVNIMLRQRHEHVDSCS